MAALREHMTIAAQILLLIPFWSTLKPIKNRKISYLDGNIDAWAE